MKVLLKEDVENLGYAGDVSNVADGYGRNYLIPKGFAVLATPKVMKQASVWRKKAEIRRAELHAEYEALAARIEEITLTFQARAGNTGKLYGSVTTSQIADTLNEKLGTEIDRRKVGTEPLRQLGKHLVPVRLSGEFQPDLTVIIESEDGEETEIVVEELIEDVIVEVDGEVVTEEIVEEVIVIASEEA
ncbi:MAG: 50S ribosomal protein L9 [Anaerolineales bacterium]|nr:50S ribosomal protein L9 [Anaerolineales bacterium]